jgi:hypothetical protein
MFNAIKKLLGVAAPEKKEPLVLTQEVAVEEITKPVTPKEKVASAKVKTETLTVKTSNVTTNTENKPKRETRKSLDKLTKAQIDELAQEKLGVELDRRKTKEVMIDEFLVAQKKAK